MNYANKLILAPMVPVNNIGFRILCTEFGADIVYGQMIDSWAFDKGNRKLADFYDEKNVVGQFLGNDPAILKRCVENLDGRVQGVDLNLGCPHADVDKRIAGSYLMKYPERIRLVVRSMVNTGIPITVKIRAGYDAEHLNAVRVAKVAAEEGVRAIGVHGRARTVNYKRKVDYSVIKAVKEAVDVPVLGNGDIFSGRDAKAMFDETGCDSVMVARGAVGNPEIFQKIRYYLKHEKEHRDEDIAKNKKRVFAKYLKNAEKYNLEFKQIRTHVQWFTKGIKHAGSIRKAINSAQTVDELQELYSTIE